MSEMRASVILQAIDRVSRPMARMSGAVSRFSRASGLSRISDQAARTGRAIDNATGQLGRFAGKMALLGGAGGFLFKTQLLDTAAAFERYQTILETTEGSNEKAQKAMAWVNEFAVRTPYELDELVQSFVKLRSYGLDPTTGLLRTLGDTSAAMGKSLTQSVEAIADAVTGENERLKEFGITARTVGNKIVYEYTANGETMRKVAQRGNRAMIQDTLTAIWNDKYGGAMDKLSTKWEGMMSNLGDQWTRFANMIMGAGVFDWMKDRLQGVLTSIDQMAASGQLQALAEQFGANLVSGLTRFWEALQAVIEIGRAGGSVLLWLHDTLGGWEPVLAAITAFIAGPFLVALGSATVAIGGFLLALMATPVGWFIAAVAAIAGAAGLIYENWGTIADFFAGIWSRIETGGQRLKLFFLDLVAEIGGMVAKLIDVVPESMRSTFGLDGLSDAIRRIDELRDRAGMDLTRMQTGGASSGAAAPGNGGLSAPPRTQVGGTLKISIDSEGRPRVRELKSDNPNVGIDVDTGLAMAMP